MIYNLTIMPKTKINTDSMSKIIEDIEQLKISKQTDDKILLPSDLDTLSDPGDTDDTDDIIQQFKLDTAKEYKDIVLFQNITAKCAEFIKNQKILRLSDKDKINIKKLINKIYVKLIIYSKEICLNNLNPIYKDYDNNFKRNISKVNTLVNKLIENSFLLKKRTAFKKPELVVFFNNAVQLFLLINEIVNYNQPLQDSQTS